MSNVRKTVSILFIVCIFVLSAGTIKGMSASIKTIDLSEGATAFTTNIDSMSKDNVLYHNRWINVNGLFHRIIGMTKITMGPTEAYGDEVYKMSNGALTFKIVKNESTDSYVENMDRLNQLVKDNGMELVYVQWPYKITKHSELPIGVTDYGNYNADSIINGLKEKNVKFIDMREELENCDINPDEWFYKTDHHWTIRTALWSSGELAKRIHEMAGIEFDSSLYDINNFNVDVRKNLFLGSQGKKTGNWYAGTDDFEIITPAYDTSFKYSAKSPARTTETEGTFEESFIFEDRLKMKYFEQNQYAAYSNGDYAETNIINNNNPDGPKVLIARDSYCCAAAPFLGLSCSKITTIDLRHLEGKTFKDYVESGDYDVVIIAYNPSSLFDGMFDFYGEIE